MHARERYEAGMGTMADLLVAQTALSRSEVVQVASRWKYQVGRAELLRTLGELEYNDPDAVAEQQTSPKD